MKDLTLSTRYALFSEISKVREDLEKFKKRYEAAEEAMSKVRTDDDAEAAQKELTMSKRLFDRQCGKVEALEDLRTELTGRDLI